MGDVMFVKLKAPAETWVQVSRIAIVMDITAKVEPTCEIRVLNDVGWTVLESRETAEEFMDRLRHFDALK